MEVRLAETFLKVAEIGSFTKGAEALGYSQSAVTLQIRQLEEILGVGLFDRVGRRIRLTKAGRDFIPYAAELIKASNSADSFTMDTVSPSGDISILAGSSVTMALLPGLISRFRKEYPNIDFDIQTIDSREAMLEGVRQNTHDFFFDTGIEIEYPGFIKAAQRYEELAFVCHISDPLLEKEDVCFSDLFDDIENDPLIIHGGSDAQYSIERLLREHDITVASRLAFSSPAAIVNTLKAGSGRCLLPRFIVENEINEKRLAVLDIEHSTRPFYSQLFYSAGRWLDPAMSAFIEYAKTELTDQGPAA